MDVIIPSFKFVIKKISLGKKDGHTCLVLQESLLSVIEANHFLHADCFA